MERRWNQVWPVWVPKTFAVDKAVSEYLREWSVLTPDAAALSFYGKNITYAELNTLIDGATWGLLSLGVEKGQRVAILMDNCPQFVIAYFAVQRAGAVAVPLNPMFKQAELEFALEDAGAQTLIGLDNLYPELAKARKNTGLKNVILTSLRDFLPEEPVLPLPADFPEASYSFPETIDFLKLVRRSPAEPICRVTDLKTDLALLQYTGGTTGIPKGAMISHHALGYACIGSMHWSHNREGDVYLGVTPFFHVQGQVQLMCTPLLSGGRVVILTRFVPEVVAQAITLYRCTNWVGLTTMVIALLNLPNLHEYDFSSFRCLWSGGATISTELQNRLKELAPNAVIGEGYGLTETISQGGAITPLYRFKPGFVGTPQLNDLKIVDRETGVRELGANEEGEIVIKGPALMKGYWNKPEETDLVMRDGWLHTGDIGLMDEEGYVKFLGREREIIKCSGYSVFPAEVESLLFRHPAVKEAAVIGVADSYRGESPKAFIVLRQGYAGEVTEKVILDWCKDNMAAYKRPRFVQFKEELPKSAAGKLLRRVLVQEEASV